MNKIVGARKLETAYDLCDYLRDKTGARFVVVAQPQYRNQIFEVWTAVGYHLLPREKEEVRDLVDAFRAMKGVDYVTKTEIRNQPPQKRRGSPRSSFSD